MAPLNAILKIYDTFVGICILFQLSIIFRLHIYANKSENAIQLKNITHTCQQYVCQNNFP